MEESKKETAVAASQSIVAIRVPVATETPAGYRQEWVNFRLSPRQADAIERVRRELAQTNQRIEDRNVRDEFGRVVVSTVDAMRWIVDAIADAAKIDS